MGFDLSCHLFGCVAVASFGKCPIFFFQTLRNIQLLHSVTCHTGRTKIYIYIYISSYVFVDLKNSYVFLCACWILFLCLSVCDVAGVQWRRSKDASCLFWMPRCAQAPIERVTIGAIFPSNHRLFERALGAAKFTATADLFPPKKSYLTFNRNFCKSDGLFSAKCLCCNSFVNLKRTDKKWTRGMKWRRQL